MLATAVVASALLKSRFTEASDPLLVSTVAFICAVELMEGEVVTVDIELTAAVTPLHIVGIYLLSITQYHRGSAADNTDIIKG